MNIERISKMMAAVQAAYEDAGKAQAHWLEYRRLAALDEIPTDAPTPFIDAMRLATEAARKIDAMRTKVEAELFGDGMLRAEIVSADGKRRRSVILVRPDAKNPQPYVTQSTYDALRRMLGDGLTTTASFDIAVQHGTSTIPTRNML